MRKFWISILSFTILLIPTVAGANDPSSYEGWADITTLYDLSENWQYQGDQGYRTSFSDNTFHLLYFRPSFRYRVKPGLTLHGGVGFFQSFLPDDADLFELRPWQGLRFVWPKIGGYMFSHLVRLEQRMVWLKDPVSDFDSTLRARYQLGFRTPTYNILFERGMYLTGAIEPFWDVETSFSENFTNRIRYFAGFGTRVSKAWRVELQYVQQDGRAIQQDSFSVNERIIRLRLFYKFN